MLKHPNPVYSFSSLNWNYLNNQPTTTIEFLNSGIDHVNTLKLATINEVLMKRFDLNH